MGLLLAALEVDGLNADKLQELQLDLSRDTEDKNARSLCPRQPTAAAKVDREALMSRLAGDEPSATGESGL